MVGTILFWLALVFLFGHLSLDMRALVRIPGNNHKDILWTVATIVFLTGHIILDFVGG